jgi:hypothetical protein
MKYLLAIAALTIAATSAGAQFTTQNYDEGPEGNNYPRCYVTKVRSKGGSERDPIAFITPALETGYDGSILEITFTMRSGAHYVRSDQYHNTTLTKHNDYDFVWTGWYSNNVRMTGHYYKVFIDDHPGHAIWHYDEYQTKNAINTFWMHSTCRN